MGASNHLRRWRSLWRSPLAAVVCLALPFLIFAWGTAYKLSLYRASTGTPAKVCTLGSDAAKSSINHAIDGHKVVSDGIAASLAESFRTTLPVVHTVALSSGYQVDLSLRAGLMLAARPPPIEVSLAS